MAWNQPGNNGQDRDPWGSGKGDNGNSGNSDGNNQGSNNQGGRRTSSSGGVDDLFQKLNNLLGKLSQGGGNQNRSGGSGSGKNSVPSISGGVVGVAIAIAVVVWGVSGFYTIKEGEVGVITRFGKNITGLQPGDHPWAQPGLNWKPTFIDRVIAVNTAKPRVLATSGIMLTADENVAHVEMNVVYQVIDPSKFLFSVTNSDESLGQATDSALRAVIGKYTLDRILTDGRTIVSTETKEELEKIISRYNIGVVINSINFQEARPPKEVQAAFNDAISAREDEQRYIVESVKYSRQVQPEAQGHAQRLLEDARAYKAKTVLEAEGEVARFTLLLPEYKKAPEVTRQRLYMETMERVLGNTSKVLIDNASNNLMVLPLDQLMKGQSGITQNQNVAPPANTLPQSPVMMPKSSASTSANATPIAVNENFSAARSTTARRGRE